MKKNEYALTCTSTWDRNKIINKYPILKNYNTRIEYPYPNPSAERLVIEVNNLQNFYEDIGEEVILGKDIVGDDNTMYSIEIYDNYRE